eukprot:COSAG01_NODE_3437_length_6098_cov_5.799800_3_plen_86_part_00
MMASASSTAVQSGEPQVVCLDGQLLCVEAVRLSLAWCACVFPCAAAVVDRRRRPRLVVAYHGIPVEWNPRSSARAFYWLPLSPNI